MSRIWGTFEDWMSFWNAGHRVTALGVTDVHGWGPPGMPRTFFQVPSDDLAAFQPAWLVDAVLAGQTQVSAGAFARVSLMGRGPGELAPAGVVMVDPSGPFVMVKVRVEAIPEIDVTRVLVLLNCDTVAEVQATDPGGVVKLDKLVKVPLGAGADKDAHIVVLAFGSKPMPKGMASIDAKTVPRVITNPILLDGDGDGTFSGPGGKACAIVPGG